MISLYSLQILPPTDDKFFEEMVCDIFNSIERTNSYDLFGRSGQKQFGIDIYSDETKTAIQCKHKLINASDKKIREELIKDLNYEFKQFLIYNKSLGDIYSKFIFATTFKSDIQLVESCQKLSQEFNFKIEYWHWKRLTDKLDDSLLLKYSHQLVSENINYYKDDQLKVYEIDIDITMPFIDQIGQYFRTLFDEVKILHTDFFLNQYPFKTPDSSTYRTNFTIDSNNEALTMFFDSFDINSGMIEMKNQNEEEKFKVEFILRTLNSNNIFYFRNKDKGFLKNIEYDTTIRDTYYIKYDQFKFIEGLKNIPKLTKNSSLDDFMQLGYFYYKADDLIKSIKIFRRAKARAILEDKGISTFICDHNLYHLGRLVYSRYWDLPDKEKVISDLVDINLNKNYSKVLHVQFYNFISSRNFFNEPKIRIEFLTNIVKERYDLFLRGGGSSTNYELDIIYEYSVLNAFLSKNYIIYDCYTEYIELVKTFLEGILASYAIKNGAERTLSIDDFYLNHALEYLNTKTIESLFLKYEIFNIKYEDNATHGYRFLNLFENLITNNYNELKAFFLKDQTNGNTFQHYFLAKRERLLHNFIYLSGVIDFDLKSTTKICELIRQYISQNEIQQHVNSDYLIKFIIQKKMLISNQDLKFFFKYIIKNKGSYSSNSLETLCGILKKATIVINFSKIEFNSLVKKIIYSIESEFIYNDSFSLFMVVKTDYQLIIKEKLLKELDNDFNFDLYYYCVIYDLIAYDYKNYFDDYLRTMDLNNLKVLNSNLFNYNHKPYKRYSEIDEILNICFKFNLDIQDSKFDLFKGISDYYDWILNIEKFNYDKFNPYWVNLYNTNFYDNHFRKYNNLKNEILKSINSNDDNRLRRIYYRIYSS